MKNLRDKLLAVEKDRAEGKRGFTLEEWEERMDRAIQKGESDMEIHVLYAAVEQAVMDDTPLMLPNGRINLVRTIMVSPTKFIIEGVYWRDDDGNVYQPVIEAQFRSRYGVAGMYVVGSVSLDWASSGITKMFCKEKRYQTII